MAGHSGMKPLRIDLPYLVTDTDRHGNRRVYVRRHGRKIRLLEKLGSAAFLEAYKEALASLDSLIRARPPERCAAPVGSLGWLATSYFSSAEFKALHQKSQATRRQVIENCLREPRKPGSRDIMAACPIGVLSAAHVLMLRDRRADSPGAANNRLKYLSAMFG
jgi:hypothetical protein